MTTQIALDAVRCARKVFAAFQAGAAGASAVLASHRWVADAVRVDSAVVSSSRSDASLGYSAFTVSASACADPMQVNQIFAWVAAVLLAAVAVGLLHALLGLVNPLLG